MATPYPIPPVVTVLSTTYIRCVPPYLPKFFTCIMTREYVVLLFSCFDLGVDMRTCLHTYTFTYARVSRGVYYALVRNRKSTQGCAVGKETHDDKTINSKCAAPVMIMFAAGAAAAATATTTATAAGRARDKATLLCHPPGKSMHEQA